MKCKTPECEYIKLDNEPYCYTCQCAIDSYRVIAGPKLDRIEQSLDNLTRLVKDSRAAQGRVEARLIADNPKCVECGFVKYEGLCPNLDCPADIIYFSGLTQ